MSRNKHLISSRYPEITAAFTQMDIPNLFAGGEIVTFSVSVTSFSRLQKRMHISQTKKAEKSPIAVYCYVFDLMYVEPFDVTKLPLRESNLVICQAINLGIIELNE